MNKFRGAQGIEGEAGFQAAGPFDFLGGFRGDLNSSEAPPNSSHEVLDVRFEKGGLRPNWGRTLIEDTGVLVVAAGIAPIYSSFGTRYIPYYVTWNEGTSEFDFYKKDYGQFDADFVLDASANLITSFEPRFDSFLTPLSSPIVPTGSILFTSLETDVIEWTVGGVPPRLKTIVGAPRAKVITNFGDRIVAGWDSAGAPMALSWTADGIYDDWTGGDSGQTLLLGVAPLDETVAVDNVTDLANTTKSMSPGSINGLVEVGNNVLAIIRANSIYRGFETGNVALAVGAVPWIQELGSMAERTVAKSKWGAIFLGNDYDIHILSETGIAVIGGPIKNELRDIAQGTFKFFSGFYLHTTDEYVIAFSDRSGGIPDTAAWIVRVDEAIGGSPRWRELSLDASILGGFAIWS